jgi:hypothetical protein
MTLKRSVGLLLVSVPFVGFYVACGLSIGFGQASVICGGIWGGFVCFILGAKWISE